MVMSTGEMFLKRTGQLSILNRGIIVTVVGAAFTFGPLISAFEPEDPIVGIAIVLVGIALGIAGSAWLCVRIKCPRCDVRIFWEAISRNSVSGWDRDLYGPTCPNCGYEPE